MYMYNKDNNSLGHVSLLLSCIAGVVLTNETKIALNS